VETVRSAGTIVVCTQCAARRELTAVDLLTGATIAGAASFVEAVLRDGVQALVY
jgi:predicted peroxiredoxin